MARRLNRAIRKVGTPRKASAPGGEIMRVSAQAQDDQSLADYGERILEALKEKGKRLKSVSGYELNKEIGRGGMGTVFLADHISEGGIRKEVAIKVLKDTTNETAIKKFVREAELLSKLTQGTVVELLALESMDIALPGNRGKRPGAARSSKLFFMVLEFVNGPGLNQVLRKHQDNGLLTSPPMVGFVLNKTVIALAEAHNLTDDNGTSLRLVHRDISPSNILFQAKAGITKLADFGVAEAFTEETDDKFRLIGKPRYMAPEQVESGAIPASDIWALGVIGYEAMTGFSPYRVFGKTTQEKAGFLRTQFSFELRPPKEIIRNDDEKFRLEKLSDIIMQCLCKNSDQRPTAEELNRMLEGEYLYAKGLGPTNKTLAAYLKLLDCAIGDGEVIPPPAYGSSNDAQTLCATLGLEDPTECFRRRTTSAYDPDFLKAVKAKQPNPCLLPKESGEMFMPVV